MSSRPVTLRAASYADCILLVGLLLPTGAADDLVADEDSNDVLALADGNNYVDAGEETVIAYRIVSTGQARNPQDGQSFCNVDDASAAVVSIIAPAPVVADPLELTFTDCGVPQ